MSLSLVIVRVFHMASIEASPSGDDSESAARKNVVDSASSAITKICEPPKRQPEPALLHERDHIAAREPEVLGDLIIALVQGLLAGLDEQDQGRFRSVSLITHVDSIHVSIHDQRHQRIPVDNHGHGIPPLHNRADRLNQLDFTGAQRHWPQNPLDRFHQPHA